MIWPGISIDIYIPLKDRPVTPVPGTTEPGIATAQHTAKAAAEVVTSTVNTGPVTGAYDPDFSALLGLDIA